MPRWPRQWYAVNAVQDHVHMRSIKMIIAREILSMRIRLVSPFAVKVRTFRSTILSSFVGLEFFTAIFDTKRKHEDLSNNLLALVFFKYEGFALHSLQFGCQIFITCTACFHAFDLHPTSRIFSNVASSLFPSDVHVSELFPRLPPTYSTPLSCRLTIPLLLDQCANGWANNIIFTSEGSSDSTVSLLTAFLCIDSCWKKGDSIATPRF